MKASTGPVPPLALSGLDADLTEQETALLSRARIFARDMMRPTAAKLDNLTARQVIEADSPFWSYLDNFNMLAVGRQEMAGLDPRQLNRMSPMLFEEYGWGDWGLAVAAFTSSFPAALLRSTGKTALIEAYSHLRGCWIATQPDRGSDVIDYPAFELATGTRQSEGSLRATIRGEEIVLTGRSSEWISCAPIAECALVHCAADYGDGVSRPDGGILGTALFVPLDLPGVLKSAPNEKIGQRSVPTGSIMFNDVRLPISHLLCGKDEYYPSVLRFLSSGAINIAAIATGVARAAFEHALHYAQTRQQGGVPLAQHQHIKWRLFEMWRKVELSRAMIRRATAYNFTVQTPQALASAAAKITATNAALEVVTEAVQIFGANGVGRAFPTEKLMRDLTAGMMQGGENHALALQGGNWLLQAYANLSDIPPHAEMRNS